MIFKPLKDRVVAIPEKASRKLSSGISMIEGSSSEQPRIARAIEVGPLVDDVKVGDRFLFQAFAASDCEISKDDKYIVIREEFIDSLVEDEKEKENK